jgi:hypothetical protein
MACSFPLRLSLFLLVACSASSPPKETPTNDAAVPLDALADAVPAYVTCADPTLPTGTNCGNLAWVKSNVTARARNHQVTAIAQTASGAFLYALGGFGGVQDSATFANVDRAPIQTDGSIGAWTSEAPLPLAAGGATGGVVAGIMVIAGGLTASGTVTTNSYVATLGDSGGISAWTTGSSILNPRMHAGSFAQGNTMYILGGFEDMQVWSDIVRATVQADGTLSPWTTVGSLPGPRSHFATTLVGNYVYLTGGLNQSAFQNPPVLTDVTRALVAADGTLTEWTSLTPLTVPLATHASLYYGGYLYVVGGINNTADDNRVWRAPVLPDATLGAWQQVASLPIARGHVHQVPMFENRAYSVAGAIDLALDSTGEVDITTFQ